MTVPLKCAPLALFAAVAGVGAVPSSALAQESRQQVLHAKHAIYESPQHFAFELRFSPFTPDIDRDTALGGTAPYALVFGSPQRLLVAAEFDWQSARIPHVGTIGPALGIGYMAADRPALLSPPLKGPSGETTTLQIVPMYVVGVLRADVLWREVGIPLVPYAKLGFGMAFWRASNTVGTSHYQGVSGLGHSFGTQLALGLGLNLNIFDDYAARNFDESMGVNGTYLFAEWSRADLTGLWFQQDPLRVGGTYWTFGLAFEF